MTAHCPLCGTRVYSLHTLRWQDALRQMPAALKQQAMRAQSDRAPASGRWLYVTRAGGALVVSPDQLQALERKAAEAAEFGEDLED